LSVIQSSERTNGKRVIAWNVGQLRFLAPTIINFRHS
jgi:hypothetical protein